MPPPGSAPITSQPPPGVTSSGISGEYKLSRQCVVLKWFLFCLFYWWFYMIEICSDIKSFEIAEGIVCLEEVCVEVFYV